MDRTYYFYNNKKFRSRSELERYLQKTYPITYEEIRSICANCETRQIEVIHRGKKSSKKVGTK